ncbi:MAG: hypothetical protein NZ602_05950 [Thermoguttaceae bacterium]|nr:hypothetical protein [Thermoguttaceae bacterium]MDW8038133.1 hypothetical protein [Thermoguttaceae bacterium]
MAKVEVKTSPLNYAEVPDVNREGEVDLCGGRKGYRFQNRVGSNGWSSRGTKNCLMHWFYLF